MSAFLLLFLAACRTLEPPVVDPPLPATEFSGGKGVENDPYLIGTAADLIELSLKTNDGESAGTYGAAFYRQMADIDLSGVEFVPICRDGVPFSGTYDGGSHRIVHLTIHTPSVRKSTAFIAQASGATIRDVFFESVDVDAGYVCSGTVVGSADGTAVSGVIVTGQFRQYIKGLTVLKVANEGFSGGLAGWIRNSTFEDCAMDGNVSIYGKGSGGLVGVVENSVVKGCRFLKGNTVNVNCPWNGGLVGIVRGGASIVSGCSFEGSLASLGYIQGGIAGQVEGGRIERCVVGSHADIGSDKYYVGGIAGAVIPVDEVVVDHCAVYGNVNGRFAVGGIAGYCGYGSPGAVHVESATRDVVISACAFIGGEITATGNNGESGYLSVAGGIVGWSHGANALTVKGCYSRPGLIRTTSFGNRGALAGVLALQNSSSGEVAVEGCYSTVTPATMLNRNVQVTAVSGYPYYGGIYSCSAKATTFTSCYCDESIKLGTDDRAAVESACEALLTAQFADGTLLGRLQASADGIRWQAGADGLPEIADLPADPNVKPGRAKRVSVIGDSISTFKGWIPSGYSGHYPTVDGKLTLVCDTWWYRLIYGHMENAMLDMNISFSATTVTNTPEDVYSAKFGPDIQAWWHKDFCARFIENGGCGQPDIILVHGGTNDWNRDIDPLAPGVAIRNDESNTYGGHKPSPAIMDAIYARADAAGTRNEIEDLPDGTFCEAYAKLLCLIRERYPRCKVVCIVGDFVGTSIEESILDIAGHYGAKCVDLLRVNGFNDLGGYSPSTLSNKGIQPNMPKHDYSGDVSGGHPAAEGMAFIAAKIYEELGAWLES